MEQKALLVVSFGTSYQDTMKQNIEATEREIAAALPDRTLFRAFTSGVILRKLAQRDGLHIDNVDSALSRLEADGFQDIVVQPTHIINGEEYEKLTGCVDAWRGRFNRVAVGAPLLTSLQDYRDAAAALTATIQAPEEDEALILMGHGTEHFSNAAYAQLEDILHDAGWKRAFLGTVEGYPALEEVLRRLSGYPEVRRVRLQPFMLVAGDHARNDMAGEGADSWKNRIEAAGYAVTCQISGLGECAPIRQIFARHAMAAETDI